MKHRLFLLCSLFLSLLSGAQSVRKEDRPLMQALEGHVQMLAADSLEGRRAGTSGERKAADYIERQMQAIGLQPKGEGGYRQAVVMYQELEVAPATLLQIDGRPLKLGEEFYPLSFSAHTATLEALPSPGLQEAGAPWFMDLSDPETGLHPHAQLDAALFKLSEGATRRGATAVIFYHSKGGGTVPRFNKAYNDVALSVPVLYLTSGAAARYLHDQDAVLDVKLHIALQRTARQGHNLLGYIDNGADRTVVIGAHYDHLGHGEDNNSLARGVRAVHNGADDNASGVAAMLELARLLKASRTKGQNYLFAAFTGEELGLYGSTHLANSLKDNSLPSFMVNLDMVGRISDTAALTVGGYGTTVLWSEVYSQKGRRAPYRGPLSFRFDSSGTGPSDHTPFYRTGVPVLFYFSGYHPQYHRPSDDADRINYGGLMHLVRHLQALLEYTAGRPKPQFLATREVATGTSARFSVTLGIVPDYTFSSGGVRVDGLTEGKPAAAIGLQRGDIITSMGGTAVRSMEDYMQALSRFKSGDRTTVTWKRGEREMNASVTF